ncbi:response regulator [bacterium]|nr:response regulator [bacterium]MCI0612082.1 response regulator [bacterium]
MKTALVVEDSAIMRGIIVSSLSNLQQVRSVEAANGFEALKALPQEKFDIILTDINMPDINGLELVSFLKNHPHYRTIPVVIISTEKSETDRKRGLELGADEYLTKPFEPGELENIIRRLLNI